MATHGRIDRRLGALNVQSLPHKLNLQVGGVTKSTATGRSNQGFSMHADQLSWTEAAGWRGGNGNGSSANLVLFFGARQALACGSRYREMRAMFPQAHILGCSTGGQIVNDDVTDDDVAVAALRFDATRLRLACEAAPAPERSRSCGEAIGRALAAKDLAGIFVLSDGLNVNGSELVPG